MQTKMLGTGSSDAEREIEAVLRGVQPWSGRTLRYAPVAGGISNSNWRVWLDGEVSSYFVKVPGRGTEQFIDRKAAFAASKQAESIGIGPRLYDYAAELGVEINDFVEGRTTCSNRDFLDAPVRASVMNAYRALHASPLLPLTKTIFDLIDEHVEQVRQAGGKLPADFPRLYREYTRARAALEASGLDIVPCFNDPMPGNFLRDEAGTILLIDYEYASNNDRCYDLGALSGEMFFTREVEEEMVESYFGSVSPANLARVTVHKALADLKWATWSMLQNEISTLDFDYFKYGAWKFMRARSVIDEPAWNELLRSC
ncbi:phosphotransferase family protein [Caballeronia sp. LjRoot34]|uniref:phosphotransferase n=1 Tax=Caballeronia sp. LjRoot34 TaxID=3342325 RepID=UPI003ED1063C